MSIISLEELQARTAFVRAIAATGSVFAVEGAEGLAKVKSPRSAGRQVELLWTDKQEAARWADALVKQPRIVALTVPMLLTRHLPNLDTAGHLVGGDWSDRPAEPEFAPIDLSQRLRRQLVDLFAETAIKTRQVWILRSGEAPATLLTRHPSGGEALDVFADRASAEHAMEGPWAQAVPVRVPLGDFLQKTIVWCIETRRRIAPAYVPGPGMIEMPPWDLKALLSGNPPARRVA